jgi:hypothetical protein
VIVSEGETEGGKATLRSFRLAVQRDVRREECGRQGVAAVLEDQNLGFDFHKSHFFVSGAQRHGVEIPLQCIHKDSPIFRRQARMDDRVASVIATAFILFTVGRVSAIRVFQSLNVYGRRFRMPDGGVLFRTWPDPRHAVARLSATARAAHHKSGEPIKQIIGFSRHMAVTIAPYTVVEFSRL